MRTIAKHIDLISAGLGRTPDSRHDPYQTINRAGKMLLLRRCWWWTLVPGVSLAAVAASADIALPADFQTLDTIALASGSGYGPVQCLTPDEYTKRVAQGTTYVPGMGTAVLLPVSTFNTTTGVETKKLKLLSAATATGSPTFTMSYYRGWTDVTVADAAKYPAVPSAFDDALMLLERACALDLEDQMDSHEMICYERAIKQLEDENVGTVMEFGTISGGASSRVSGGIDGLTGQITFP